MPDERPARPAGAQRRIIERPRLADTLESASMSQRMAQIYGARGIETAEQLDLTLGSLLRPAQLDGAQQAANMIADSVMAAHHRPPKWPRLTRSPA